MNTFRFTLLLLPAGAALRTLSERLEPEHDRGDQSGMCHWQRANAWGAPFGGAAACRTGQHGSIACRCLRREACVAVRPERRNPP